MASDINQSSLNLSSEEKRVYGQLFQQADTEGLGVVTGDVAVKFFERTKLNAEHLGEIWQLADSENRGLLTPAGFSVALRLIGHCQAGRTPSIELASRPGPLPRFDGSSIPAQSQRPSTPTQPLNPQSTGGSFVNPQATGQPIRVPPLTPDKVLEYQSLFEKAGARNGILGGDAAKQMFEKAKLPNDVLGRIWNLADGEQRGALNLTEFTIAMHLLTSMRIGALRALPQNLPAGLYEAAGRRPTLQGPSAIPIGAVPRQFTGQGHQRTASPLSRPFGTPELTAQGSGNDWLVSPQDKAKFDQIFASVDKTGLGLINGEQAVQFFSNSGLSEDTLASIWDLADIRSEGQLNREEFAVAMYLIRQQRGKKDDRDSLPSVLPTKLIPPSMRQREIPPSQPTAPAFDNATFASSQQPKSASEDLFGLDALATDTKPPQPLASPMISSPLLQASQSSQPTQPFRPPQHTSSTSFKPFMPSSAFGQGIVAQHSGPQSQQIPTQSRELPRPQPSAAADLLGDNDPEISNKLTDETTEFANMSNQISTLRTQSQEVQNRKVTAESNMSTASNQKRELEGRLAQIRSQYEQEVKQVKSLEERLNVSRNETRKMQQELAMLEGTYQDLQNQNQQTAAALDVEQRENAALKERMRQINAEVAGLRPQVDKMKSDARQQKGLVAINKKQLATSEAERDKLQSEMSEFKREHEDALREDGEVLKALEAAKNETAQLRSKAQQDAFQREAEREATRSRQAAQREALQREKAQHEAEQRQIAQREADQRQAAQREAAQLEEAQREAAQREAAHREVAQREAAAREPTQREVAVQDGTSSVVSPAASAVSQKTNPFFRKSPQPPFERVLSPSIFSQEFGAPATSTDFDSFFGSNEQYEAVSPFPESKDEHDRAVESAPTPSVAGVSTPPTPFSRPLEPPAPPQSRQITSSFLPFKSELTRSESFSSSVRANPPASRSGMSAAGTPTQIPTSPSASVNGDAGQVIGSPPNRLTEKALEQVETSTNITTHAQGVTTSRSPSPVAKTYTQEAAASHMRGESIPGAFPHSPMGSTPTGGSFTSERAAGQAANPSQSTLDDPFATKEDEFNLAFPAQENVATGSHDPPLGSREITDSTTPSTPVPSNMSSSGSQRPHTEFPPIQEFDQGDDSESDNNDDFGEQFSATPALMGQSTLPHSGASDTAENPPVPTNELLVSNQSVAEVESSSDSQPPTPNTQKSPPTYDQTVPQPATGEHRESNKFPQQYGGLLPSREIVSSPPAEVPQSAPSSLNASVLMSEPPSGVNLGPYQPQYSAGKATQSTFSPGPPSFLSDGTFQPPWLANRTADSTIKTGLPSSSFGGYSYQAPLTSNNSTEVAPMKSGDDFDDEFADLDEAREADDLGNDTFVINSNRKDRSEFDPAFENPVPINPSTFNFQGGSPAAQPSQGSSANRFTDFISSFQPSSTAQQQETTSVSKQENAGDFNFGFGPSSPSSPAKQTSGTGASGFSSFNPSASVAGSSTMSYQSSPQLSKGEASSGAHDWDSIFAGLDNNSAAQSNGAGKDPFAAVDNQPPRTNANEIGPAPPPKQQSYQPPRVDDYVTPALPQRQPQPQQRQKQEDFQQQQRYQPPQSPPLTQKERPVPGRALSMGTEHDDPILKNLTGMGFNREDALKTLERFDYNIDKAVDYLSKQQ